ncbi:hypothetical protein DTO96_101990 [Ephemeroptericola cinctiostellae]|uniref:Uncharacterized protein n=1 Tax=Ephemeroptericola cinctiostellae TaxID=2268024 RepID=A0A345DD06_9BURK|nr:hypothetical protein [Ephemeroptericola cinctiostellae]AXF86244.1 hypothetical protein DTO96_101990 [Ephemeroptericola cinctiostellae]
MITRMQVEMAKSLYEQAHRAAEFAHAGWLVRQNLYRLMFPLASDEEFAKMMAVPNAHYEQAIESMKQLRDAYEKIAAELTEK